MPILNGGTHLKFHRASAIFVPFVPSVPYFPNPSNPPIHPLDFLLPKIDPNDHIRNMHARARRWFAILAMALVLLVLLAWAILSQREPVYRGKTLTDWGKQYFFSQTANRAAAEEAQFAIRQIGTNHIPFMLNLIRATDRQWANKLRTFVPMNYDGSVMLRRSGAYAIAALGTNAPAAVPRLIEIATTHPDSDGRYYAVFALRNIGPAAEAAVPFYIQSLTNADPAIRNEAAMGLTSVPRHWQTSLPHLVRYMETVNVRGNPSREWEMKRAVALLGQMSTNAQPAVPMLLTFLNDPAASVREALTNSLLSIDLDAATQAGVKRH